MSEAGTTFDEFFDSFYRDIAVGEINVFQSVAAFTVCVCVCMRMYV